MAVKMNQVKKELVPKLRFPEFKKDGDWEEKKLGEIADYENGKAHEQDISDHGKYLVVNSKFISTEGGVRKFTNEGHCLAEKGEILMVLSDVPNGRAIAKCFLIDESNKYTVNQRICRIKPRENVSGFIFCILNRNEFYLNFDDGVKQTNLRREDVLDCPIFLPTKKEQTRISDCLSSLDELIEAEDQKLEALQRHKKGLMQELFPVNGETLTKLRFKEFEKDGEWEEIILSDVLTEHKLKNDGKSKVHSVSVHKGIIDQIEHLGRSFASSDTSKYNLVKPFDIVYTKSPTGDFPFGIIKQSRLDYNVIVSPLYGVFSPKNKYLGYILNCYFESPIRTKNYLDPITQKGAKNTIQISNDTFISRGLYLPEDEIEQQKIADCLSSIDNLITNQTKKLESLRLHKKGLMQQLFPNFSEAQ